MPSSAIVTVVKMMEILPLDTQEEIAEHLREYINDLQDEARWEASFKNTQPNLIAAARRAREQTAKGQSSPMDYDKL